MAGAKLMVLHPTPHDVKAFERAYTLVVSKVVGTADGSAAPFYRIAELHFPSMEALQTAAASAPAQKAGTRRLNLEWREAHFPRG